MWTLAPCFGPAFPHRGLVAFGIAGQSPSPPSIQAMPMLVDSDEIALGLGPGIGRDIVTGERERYGVRVVATACTLTNSP